MRSSAEARAQTAAAGLLAGSVFLLVLYSLHTLSLLGGHATDALFLKWVNDAVVVLAAAACLLRALTSRKERVVWLLFSVGMVSWVAGNIYYSIWLIDLNPLPVPSVADGLWLGMYPPFYAAIMMLVARRVRSFQLSVWLDGLVGALMIGAVSAAVVLQGVLGAAYDSRAELATNVAYPVADLTLLALVVAAIALAGWRLDRTLALLTTGLIAFTVTDSLFLIKTADASYTVGTIIDAGWLLAAVLVSVAAWQPRRQFQSVDLRATRMLVVPGVFASVALVLVVWDHFERLNVPAISLTVTALAVVALRLVLTLREREGAVKAVKQAGARVLAAEESLRGSELQYRVLFEQNPNPMWVHDRETHGFLAVNDAAVAHYGYSREEFLSMSIFDIRSTEERALLRAHLADVTNPAYQRPFWRHRLRDGRVIEVQVFANDIEFEGRPGRFLLAVDVTARLQAEHSLQASEKRFRDLFENAGEPIATVDLKGVITEVNGAFARALGYPRERLIGTQINDYVIPESQEAARRARERKLAGEVEVTTYEQEFLASDGHHVTMEVSTRVIAEDGRPVGVQGMCRDITDRKRAEAELRRLVEVNHHQALHDALTGLPNRVAFLSHVARSIAGAGPGELAVLLLDVDRFKEINDTLGHHDGDRLLGELSDRLRSTLREGDLVARLGGDEFGILLEGARDARAASQRAIERIAQTLELPVYLQGLPITIQVSIGVALHPAHGFDADTLLQHADVAMYVAKDEPHGYAYYSRDHHDLRTDRLTLIGELRRAIDRQELLVQYQPIVELEGGALVGAEALVRWQHPTRGLLSPAEFIPVAERTGLITPLTLYVLEAALKQRDRWERPGAALRVSVNVSVRSLLDGDFPAQVESALARSETPPDRLVLEMTESAIMLDPQRAGRALAELARHGIGIAVDDFGTGYSSLAYLRRLPLNELKIDQSFVTNLATDADSAMIVRSIVHLAHNLGLKVVAEGVESEEVWKLLRDEGCDLAQGFFISEPLPRDTFAQHLKLGKHASPGIAA